jgi:hypothetical protein
MKDSEYKAARLVTEGAVTVEMIEYDDDGDLRIAAGTVKGDSGVVYAVSVTPGTAYCSCPYGENRPGVRHSHTVAMQLAAWYQQQKKKEDG